jgi:hypothetical protein
VWSRFNEIYGHQWASQQGAEPNDTWARGLADITNEQFGAGLRAVLKRTDNWPPNLVEFRRLCTGHDPESWQRQAHKIIQTDNMIENKTAKEKRASEGLEQLRKLRKEQGI